MTRWIWPFCLGMAAAYAAIADEPEAPAPQGPSAEQLAELHAACDADVQKLCPGIEPGGGRILACLKQHKDAVSDTCKQTILKAMQKPPS
jgi:cysteine rich repeat protein